MRATLRLFYALTLLRAGPQDLPHSGNLLATALLLYGATTVLAALQLMPPATALWQGLAEVLITVALVHSALLLRGFAVRATQSLTALTGCNALFNALALPALHLQGNSMRLGESLPAPVSLWLGALLLWSLTVSVHILREALEIPLLASVLLNIGFMFVILTLLGLAFGVPGAAA